MSLLKRIEQGQTKPTDPSLPQNQARACRLQGHKQIRVVFLEVFRPAGHPLQAHLHSLALILI